MHKPEIFKLLGHLRHVTGAYTLEIACPPKKPAYTVT